MGIVKIKIKTVFRNIIPILLKVEQHNELQSKFLYYE